jgi:cell division protein FtsI (penicillin-binding protein 3)
LRTMLEQVTTENGTAPAAAIAGYRVAGKTGTANAIGADGRYSGYTSSFVGMAPADNPQLVVEAVLIKPQGDIYGGTVAGPVFQKVMSFALQTLRIPPSTTVAPALPLGG